MHRHHRVVRLFGYFISAVCLIALALRVDWPLFFGYFKTASLLPLAAAVPLLAATYFLFAMRWRLLLSFTPKPPVVQVFSFLMLGYFANVILPMRAGDALRVVLLRQTYGHGTARALSSITLERLLDVLTILAFGTVIAFLGDLPEIILTFLRTAGIIAAAGLGVLISVATRPLVASAIIEGMVRPFSARLAKALVFQTKQFIEAVSIIFPRDRSSVARAAAVVAFTVGGWSSYGMAMALCTAAFGIQPAVAAGLLVMVVTNLGSAIPSSPASLGVYHALGVVALSPWHVGLDLALSVATATHAIVVGVQLVLGLWPLVLLGKHGGLTIKASLSDRGSQ